MSVMYTTDTIPCCHNLVLLLPIMPSEINKVIFDGAYMKMDGSWKHLTTHFGKNNLLSDNRKCHLVGFQNSKFVGGMPLDP